MDIPSVLTGEQNPAPNPAPAPADDAGSWLTALPADLKGVAEHKGWKSPEDALKSYTHLEQLMGADKAGRGLILPKDAEDKDGYDRVYKALGRPENPDDYGIKSLVLEAADAPLDEGDAFLVETMSKTMHEAGLSTGQAKKLAEAMQGAVKAAGDKAEAAFQAELDAFERQVKPGEVEMARRGFRFFGLPESEAGEVGAALVRALGPEKAVKMFAQLGGALGEDKTIEGGRSMGGFSSPESAGKRMDQLLSDEAFAKRYQNGDQSAMEEITNLSKIVASGR